MEDYIGLANKATDAERFEEAERYLELAIEVGPSHFLPRYVCGDTDSGLIKLAIALGKKKRWEQAVRCLQRAEQILPGFYRIADFGWHYLMKEAAKAGEVDFAFQSFNRVPKKSDVYDAVKQVLISELLDLAEHWAIHGKLDEISPLLERILAFAPDCKNKVCLAYLWSAAESAKRKRWSNVERFLSRAPQVDSEEEDELTAYMMYISEIAVSLGNEEYARELRDRVQYL